MLASYPAQTTASRCTRINTSKGLVHEEPPRHRRRLSNRMPKALALRTSVVWALAAREARKAVEAPPRRRPGSTVLAQADSRRALGHRHRPADQDRLSKLRGALRVTWGTRKLRQRAHFTRLMALPRRSKVDSTGSEHTSHSSLLHLR